MITLKNKLLWDFRLVDWRCQRIFRPLCYFGIHLAWIGIALDEYGREYENCLHCGKERKVLSKVEKFGKGMYK